MKQKARIYPGIAARSLRGAAIFRHFFWNLPKTFYFCLRMKGD